MLPGHFADDGVDFSFCCSHIKLGWWFATLWDLIFQYHDALVIKMNSCHSCALLNLHFFWR